MTAAPPKEPPVFSIRIPARIVGAVLALTVLAVVGALASWSVDDPSFSYATAKPVQNWLGFPGAVVADLMFQLFGLAALVALLPPAIWSYSLCHRRVPSRFFLRLAAWLGGVLLAGGLFSCIAVPGSWPLPTGLGGLAGSAFTTLFSLIAGDVPSGTGALVYAAILAAPTLGVLWLSLGLNTNGLEDRPSDGEIDEEADRTGIFDIVLGGLVHMIFTAGTAWRRAWARHRDGNQADLPAHGYGDAEPVEPSFDAPPVERLERREPVIETYSSSSSRAVAEADDDYYDADEAEFDDDVAPAPQAANARVAAPAPRPAPGKRQSREAQGSLLDTEGFELPELSLLAEPRHQGLAAEHRPEQLEAKARRLEGVLEDFGVKGDIINVRPGPVVTLYELEPAPGIKSSRVISLADDIARSMSAISARVAVVPGRNAIGIELPNYDRETVYLREMLASADFEKMKGKLNICLGKTIGGEPVIADLARMPHLLVAGTTGSGKSVAINTMILSLLYQMTPEQCRLIMIDPKMLELSIYDGIPHLLTPVVTDPGKAVVALKWAVREMEDRYRKMTKIGVRNIDGFNQRVAEAPEEGRDHHPHRADRLRQARPARRSIESEEFDLEPLPYIVVIVDEMADLMMVAGKDIEGAIQRLAQMARAAGIHLIMATQRPSVDVITGTIKANFPTRISFQVTSKIDSRTILGEQGAEQLLGNGRHALHGRRRPHPPPARPLRRPMARSRRSSPTSRRQGAPDYLESITAEEDEDGAGMRRRIRRLGRRALRQGRQCRSAATRRPRPPTSSAACRSATTRRHADRAHGAGRRHLARQPCRQARDAGRRRRRLLTGVHAPFRPPGPISETKKLAGGNLGSRLPLLWIHVKRSLQADPVLPQSPAIESEPTPQKGL